MQNEKDKKIKEIYKCMEDSKVVMVIYEDNLLAVMCEKKLGIEFEIMKTCGMDFFLTQNLYI